jgi:hypothetical protein
MGSKEDAVRKNGSIPSIDEQRVQKKEDTYTSNLEE